MNVLKTMVVVGLAALLMAVGSSACLGAVTLSEGCMQLIGGGCTPLWICSYDGDPCNAEKCDPLAAYPCPNSGPAMGKCSSSNLSQSCETDDLGWEHCTSPLEDTWCGISYENSTCSPDIGGVYRCQGGSPTYPEEGCGGFHCTRSH